MPKDQTGTSKIATEPVVRPLFHHVNLKTTRLTEMLEWYGLVTGGTPTFVSPAVGFLSNDGANHRIALLAIPHLKDRDALQSGLHHVGFEYETFNDLMDSYQRLDRHGIRPYFCLDHGLTTSFYYRDPDQNAVELQVDNFGDWSKSKEWMRSSDAFRANPIGVLIDPEKLLKARAEGMAFPEIHRRAMNQEFLPHPLPDMESSEYL